MPPRPEMQNEAFDQDEEKGSVELRDVKVNPNPAKTPTPVSPKTPRPHLCQPDVCKTMHEQFLQNKSMAVNPWNALKSKFLVGIIGVLGVWVILYTASSCLGLV